MTQQISNVPIYFAYSSCFYNFSIERCCMKAIVAHFSQIVPWFSLVNIESSNQSHHEQGCDEYETRLCYFGNEIFPHCGGAICLIYSDGKWGRDVAEDAGWFIENKKPVWTISSKGVVQNLSDSERPLIYSKDPALVLSQLETQQRTAQERIHQQLAKL